jgi:cold shock CspA family protein
MTIAVLKSFNRGHGLAILKLDGKSSEFAARITGSDRVVMSSIVPGQKVQFDIHRDRHGRTYAVDVKPAHGAAY